MPKAIITPKKLQTISNNSKYRLGIQICRSSKKNARKNKKKYNLLKKIFSLYAR